jgi:hypothetical protein
MFSNPEKMKMRLGGGVITFLFVRGVENRPTQNKSGRRQAERLPYNQNLERTES